MCVSLSAGVDELGLPIVSWEDQPDTQADALRRRQQAMAASLSGVPEPVMSWQDRQREREDYSQG